MEKMFLKKVSNKLAIVVLGLLVGGAFGIETSAATTVGARATANFINKKQDQSVLWPGATFRRNLTEMWIEGVDLKGRKFTIRLEEATPEHLALLTQNLSIKERIHAKFLIGSLFKGDSGELLTPVKEGIESKKYRVYAIKDEEGTVVGLIWGNIDGENPDGKLFIAKKYARNGYGIQAIITAVHGGGLYYEGGIEKTNQASLFATASAMERGNLELFLNCEDRLDLHHRPVTANELIQLATTGTSKNPYLNEVAEGMGAVRFKLLPR
ncbi:MAG: hypothetical protein LBQ43_03985 [Holosporales bacterium]|jgi:hypothetical protein|nr:hypothetical protein [Holosporales bacterium]